MGLLPLEPSFAIHAETTGCLVSCTLHACVDHSGMSASPEPIDQAQAGPSRPSALADSTSKKPNGRKRKAGGDGKKGKIFLEDKVRLLCSESWPYGRNADLQQAGLMSLMADVTGGKDSIVQNKLDKQRQRNPSKPAIPEPTTSAANVDKAKLRHDKKKDRNRALVRPRAAKELISRWADLMS
jgi:hypothetical protein